MIKRQCLNIFYIPGKRNTFFVCVGNKTSNCTIESGDIVDLEIHIVADKSEIYVGDNIVYTVTVINNGPSDAINTIANILIPNALSIFSYDATKGTFDITSGNWSNRKLNKW